MSSPTTVDTFDSALKQIYRPQNMAELTLKNRVLFGMIPKFTGFGGRNMPLVALYGNPQGVSADFQTAQANASAVLMEDFVMTRRSLHSVATIEEEVIDATMGDNESFMEALTTKIDAAWRALADVIETHLFRSQYGDIGTATNSSTTVTMSEAREIHVIERNMVLVAAATQTGALLAGSARVTAVNRVAGTFTIDAAPAAWTGTMYLYVQGNAYNNSSAKVFSGLIDWVPNSAPSSASFYGVDRTVDSRLYGSAYDGSGGPVKDALIDAQSQAAEFEGNPSDAFVHHVQYRRLAKEMEASKDYVTETARGTFGPVANIGYKALLIHGDNGEIRVWASNKCQAERGFVLELDEWTFATLKEAPKFNMGPGRGRQGLIVVSNKDELEVRLVARGNVMTVAPCHNVNVQLPAVA